MAGTTEELVKQICWNNGAANEIFTPGHTNINTTSPTPFDDVAEPKLMTKNLSCVRKP